LVKSKGMIIQDSTAGYTMEIAVQTLADNDADVCRHYEVHYQPYVYGTVAKSWSLAKIFGPSLSWFKIFFN